MDGRHVRLETGGEVTMMALSGDLAFEFELYPLLGQAPTKAPTSIFRPHLTSPHRSPLSRP